MLKGISELRELFQDWAQRPAMVTGVYSLGSFIIKNHNYCLVDYLVVN